MSKYPTYPPIKHCAECGGQCCKRMPGHYSPSDFPDLSFEALKAEIDKGRIAIDWWESYPRKYYLRARHAGENVVNGSWGGICVNLTPTGCSLPRDDRPLSCRNLKPSATGNCRGSYSKEDCCGEWEQYSGILNQLVEHYGGSEIDPLEQMAKYWEHMKSVFGIDY